MNIKSKADIVKIILGYRHTGINKPRGVAFAPVNIALCKYWGKRDKELNLPVTSSISISLENIGTQTCVSLIKENDQIVLNNTPISLDTEFAKRVIHFLDLFRFDPDMHFLVDTKNDIPTSTGLASSASGFAALVQAVNDLFMWNLDKINLSILARLGSGSACRSLWTGFVKWRAGMARDGMDSFAKVLPSVWPQLRIGLLILSREPKVVSSREAMSRTVGTSPFYSLWPQKVAKDIETLEQAISIQDFHLFGKTVESNALAMHACMMSSWPPLIYSIPETTETIHQIWRLRSKGLPVYFTQDAGPNLMLLFLVQNEHDIRQEFPNIEIVAPFENLKRGH